MFDMFINTIFYQTWLSLQNKFYSVNADLSISFNGNPLGKIYNFIYKEITRQHANREHI